jgi:hypothetical protein
MKPNNQLSATEKRYLENEEFNKLNVDEVPVEKKKSKAEVFRKANGFSLTMSKLMIKWKCATVDAYRAIRRQHKKENYIGPKREKKPVEVVATPEYSNKNRNKNYKGKNHR